MGRVASYQPGDHVHVASFGKGIVREVRNHGRYLVEVKGRAMEVADSQLSLVDASARTKSIGRGGASAFANAAADRSGPPEVSERRASDGGTVTLDLHGHTVEEALDALDACLNDALLAGVSEIRVIHGKSGGRIRAAVHRRLGQLPSVRAFRIDAANVGVTIAVL